MKCQVVLSYIGNSLRKSNHDLWYTGILNLEDFCCLFLRHFACNCVIFLKINSTFFGKEEVESSKQLPFAVNTATSICTYVLLLQRLFCWLFCIHKPTDKKLILHNICQNQYLPVVTAVWGRCSDIAWAENTLHFRTYRCCYVWMKQTLDFLLKT